MHLIPLHEGERETVQTLTSLTKMTDGWKNAAGAHSGGVYTTPFSPNPFTIQVSIPIASARIWSVYTKPFLQHSNSHDEGALLQTPDTQVLRCELL